MTLSDTVYQEIVAAIQMSEAWKERGLKAKRSGWNQEAWLCEQRNEVVVEGWGNVKGREGLGFFCVWGGEFLFLAIYSRNEITRPCLQAEGPRTGEGWPHETQPTQTQPSLGASPCPEHFAKFSPLICTATL